MYRLKSVFPLLLVIGVLLSCGLGEKAKQVTQLARTVEEAQKNLADGDTSGAFGALLGGGEAVQPVDFRSLTPLLPANLPGFEKRNAGGEKSSLMGMATSKAEAEYHSDESSSRIDLSIHDLGSVRGFGMLGFNWLQMDIDKKDENGYERTTEYEGYPAFEKFQQDGEWSRGQMSVFVADRFIVTADGNGVSHETIRDVLGRLDLNRLEALRDEGVGEASPGAQDAADFLSRLSKGDDEAGDAVDGEAEGDASGPASGFLEDLSNGRGVEPIDFRELQVFLPDDLAGLPRSTMEGETGGAAGISMSSVTGTYEDENDTSTRVTIEVIDTGTLGGAALLGGYGWLMMQVDKETDDGFERTIAYEGHPGYEKFSRTGTSSQGTLQVIVGKRFVVEIASRGLEMESVRAAMDRIDLDELNAMKNAGATPES